MCNRQELCAIGKSYVQHARAVNRNKKNYAGGTEWEREHHQSRRVRNTWITKVVKIKSDKMYCTTVK